MSVDLSDLIPSLKRAVAAPGEEDTTFPNANDDSFLGYLQDAFWECRLDGMLATYSEDGEGLVSPSSGTTELTRDLQQLVVLYAALDIVFNQMRALNTAFRAAAGPAQFEIGKSAQLLQRILDELKTRRDIVLLRLSDVGAVPTYVIDALAGREQSIAFGDTFWAGA